MDRSRHWPWMPASAGMTGNLGLHTLLAGLRRHLTLRYCSLAYRKLPYVV
jgi:hypothetical protein